MRKTLLLSLGLILGLCVGCVDVFESEIGSETVFLLSPADSATVADSVIKFWWDPVPDARYYQFQLVKGTFETPINLVVDTSIIANQYAVKLSQGTYQWQVSAYNSNDATPFYYRTVFVP